MENLIRILAMPDNIPISAILLASIFLIWLSFRKAFKNDKLIKLGEKEKILDEMEQR
jgi:hypothetical protein